MATQIKKKFIENGAVDGVKLRLLLNQAIIQEGALGDIELIKLDSDGKVQLATGEAAVKADISQEEAARIAADTALELSVSKNANDIVSLESTSNDRDDALQVLIDALTSDIVLESSTRQAADENLQQQINNILSNIDPSALDSLTEIVEAFQNADSDLQDAINAALGTHTSELAIETSARIAADEALQNSINAEVERAILADATLEAKLAAAESQVQQLQSIVWYDEKIVVDSTVIANGFIMLQRIPETGSVIGNIDRLSIFEGETEDFIVDNAKVTFLNTLVGTGNQKIQIGDELRFKYRS